MHDPYELGDPSVAWFHRDWDNAGDCVLGGEVDAGTFKNFDRLVVEGRMWSSGGGDDWESGFEAERVVEGTPRVYYDLHPHAECDSCNGSGFTMKDAGPGAGAYDMVTDCPREHVKGGVLLPRKKGDYLEVYGPLRPKDKEVF